MARSTGRESSLGPIDPVIKAISTRTKCKASALSNGQMERSTAETGRTASCTAAETYSSKMENATSASSARTP